MLTLNNRFRLGRLLANAHLLRAVAIAAALVVLTKGVGALREMATAARFGTQPEVDAYFLVYNAISYPVVIAVVVIPAVLIPVLLDARAQHHLDEFFRELLGWGLVSTFALTLSASVVFAWMLNAGVIPAPGPVAGLAARYIGLMWLLLPFGLLSSFGIASLMSRRRQIVGLLEGVPAAVILAFVLAWDDPWALVIGAVFGQALYLGILAFAAPELRSFRGPLSLSTRSPLWPRFWRGLGWCLAAQALISAAPLVDQFFALSLGVGFNASWGYANRLTALINGVIATAVYRMLLPELVRLRPTPDRVRTVVANWTLLVIGGSAVMIIGVWPLAPIVVDLLYRRGEFSDTDAALVTLLFRYSLFQVPFYCLTALYTQVLVSAAGYRALFFVSLINFAAKVLLAFYLTPLYGALGLVVSGTIAYLVSTVTILAASRSMEQRAQIF